VRERPLAASAKVNVARQRPVGSAGLVPDATPSSRPHLVFARHVGIPLSFSFVACERMRSDALQRAPQLV
jgi:hypothetical protein